MNRLWAEHDKRVARHTWVARVTQWVLLMGLLTLAAWAFMPEIST